jgi:hypothetical protein
MQEYRLGLVPRLVRQRHDVSLAGSFTECLVPGTPGSFFQTNPWMQHERMVCEAHGCQRQSQCTGELLAALQVADRLRTDAMIDVKELYLRRNRACDSHEQDGQRERVGSARKADDNSFWRSRQVTPVCREKALAK